MGSLPVFVKILKRRFSIMTKPQAGSTWGLSWEDRFHSVRVEDSGAAARQAVAALYRLECPPGSCGIVKDPKDYRFCGYGEVMHLAGALPGFLLFYKVASGAEARP